jgi:hypothetical protein
MSDNLHRVTVEVDGFIHLSFECLADGSTDPACYMVCPESECEEGCQDPDNHTFVNHGECMVTTWLENSDSEDCILDGRMTEVTLPIEYDWHSEGVDWKFGEIVAADAGATP